MFASLDKFRAMDLHVFSSPEASVLFSPETLQLFLLNATSEAVITELRAGREPGAVAADHAVRDDSVQSLIDRIVSDIESSPVVRPDEPPSPRKQSPLPKLVLMVNNFCNLKCTYCYEHETVFSKPALVMSTDIAETALKKFYDAFSTVQLLMFIGGEPTLNPEVIEFACERAQGLAAERGQPPPSFCMISNGLKIDDALFGVMRRFNIQTTFSVDGPQKVNDLIRIRHDHSGSFDAVARNIKRFAAEFPDQVGLECTITAAHARSGISVKNVLNFAASEFGVKHPHIAPAGLPPGHPLDPYRDGGATMVREYEEAAQESVANLLDGMVREGRYSPAAGALDEVSSVFSSLVRRKGHVQMCPAGTTQLTVDAFGDVYPCWMFAGMDRFRMGNVMRDEVFNDLAAKVLARIAANTKKTNPECSRCYARYTCSACIGNNQNATGGIETMSDAFCNVIRGNLRTVVLGLGKARTNPDRWNAVVAAARQAREDHGDSGLPDAGSPAC